MCAPIVGNGVEPTCVVPSEEHLKKQEYIAINNLYSTREIERSVQNFKIGKNLLIKKLRNLKLRKLKLKNLKFLMLRQKLKNCQRTIAKIVKQPHYVYSSGLLDFDAFSTK